MPDKEETEKKKNLAPAKESGTAPAAPATFPQTPAPAPGDFPGAKTVPRILYTDDALAVVVKPVGLLSEPGAGSLPEALSASLGPLFPVQRLDRAVGGVMVYARTKKAAAVLSRAVAERKIKKEYVAVVAGELPSFGRFSDYLFKDAAQNKAFLVDTPRRGARAAELTYFVTGRAVTPAGAALSRAAVTLLTGRSNQIRAQFAGHGFPLVGDGKYGSRLRAPAPALFSAFLSFAHPESGRALAFHEPPPPVFPFDLFPASHPEIERKFLIARPDEADLSARPGVRVREIEQTYLCSLKGETRRVRRVLEDGRVSYIYTNKRRISDLTAAEEEYPVSEAHYRSLLAQADPARRTIRKTRYAFPTGRHTAEVDIYPFFADRAVMEIELSDENEPFSLPPGILVLRDVSADPRYKNAALAKEIPDDPLG